MSFENQNSESSLQWSSRLTPTLCSRDTSLFISLSPRFSLAILRLPLSSMVPNYTSFSLLSSSVHSASTSCPFLPSWWLYVTAGPQLWRSSHVTAARGNYKLWPAVPNQGDCSHRLRHRDAKISVWKKGSSFWRWPWGHPCFLSLATSHCQSLSAAEGLPESSTSPCSCITPMLYIV